MANGNPFYVAPLGGLQGVNQITQGMQAIGATAEQARQEQQQADLRAEAQRLMQEGSPREIAAFSAANPQIGEGMMRGIQFRNQATEQNMKESMQRIIAGEDPISVIQQRGQMVQAEGGDPSDTMRDLEMAQQDPEAYREMISRVYAMRYGEEGVPGMAGPEQPSAVREFEYFQSLTPEQQEQYQAVKRGTKTVNIGGVEYLPMPDGTLRPLTIDTGEGRQQVTPETTAQTEATITRETERAKQEVEAGSPKAVREREEAARSARMNIASTQDIVSQADNILTNESFIDSLTGTRGVLPAVPGTSGFDATIALERLKNSLTLGNLDKMSGVLSESDIKILASEAGGLEPGMSREAMIERLNQIRSVFQNKTEEERRKLSKMMAEGAGGEGSEQNQSIDDLINKYAD